MYVCIHVKNENAMQNYAFLIISASKTKEI